MLLSLSLDIVSTGQGTEPLADFKARATRIGQARPDFVLLAGEEADGTSAPPALEALVDSAWITGILTSSCVVVGLPALHAVPFHVARALSAIDFLSGARSGWMPMLRNAPRFDAAYGTELAVADEAEQTARHDDFIRATQALWDSWDADALIIDKAAGRYLDAGKIRRVDYRGTHYSTMGPLNAAHPPQGYPVLVRDADDVAASSVAADVALGCLGALEAANARIKLLKADAGSQASIDAALAAFAEGGVHGIHLFGPEAPEALEGLRANTPARPAAASARAALGLEIPANPYSQGVFQ